MKIFKITFLFLTTMSFAQDGYWDKERITSKEIQLSAGERTIVKSEDFPDGTTEFVYRITLLDENQKLVSDLASVLKAIPDPYFIGKGTGGAINLASAISGSDKCTYAIFSNNTKAKDYAKTANIKTACLYQNNPVSKDAKVVSVEKSTCLNELNQNIWFGFESKNWILGQKIILEIIPWIDNKASKIWSDGKKQMALRFIKRNEIAQKLPNSDAFKYNIVEKLQNEYKFSIFQKLASVEKDQAINKYEIIALTETNSIEIYNKVIRKEISVLIEAGKLEDAITLINQKVMDKGIGKALDYNALAELYLYTKQYEKAFQNLKIAEKADAAELSIQLNLAHVYLFLDKVNESKEIHKRFMNQNISATQSWKDKTNLDFENFTKRDLPNTNFKKISKILK